MCVLVWLESFCRPLLNSSTAEVWMDSADRLCLFLLQSSYAADKNMGYALSMCIVSVVLGCLVLKGVIANI